MTDSSTDNGGSAKNSSVHQSLTQIEGIGEAKRQWLESIGIQIIRDLANADAGDVASQLEAINHPTSRSVIDNWIFQAQRLVETLGANEDAPLEDLSSGTSSSVETQISGEETEQAMEASDTSGSMLKDDFFESEEAPEDLEKRADWEAFASFTVNFEVKQVRDKIQYQTSVRHIETDQTQTWPDLEEENLQTWLRQQIADAIPTLAESIIAEPPASTTWFTPLVEELRIYQPPSGRNSMEIYKPNLMFPSPVKGNLPFVLEMEFRIQEQETFSKIKQEVLYEAECYARSLKRGDIVSLGHIIPTVLDKQDEPYTVRFPAASLQPGFFRLQFLLNLRGIHAFPVFFEIPAMQVS
jgi:predicted RecB family nuclease